MSEHEDLIARGEQRADDLEERTDALGEQIDDTRKDWERKKADPNVPGAAGNPQAAEGDLPPERNVTQQGD
jgi:hypothetical protein